MSSEAIKLTAVIMSVFFLFIFIVLLTTAKTDLQKNASTKNFKDFVTDMIKEQSTNIQTLLRKIQTNAQSVLEKIETLKESKPNREKHTSNHEIGQVESPLKTNLIIDTYPKESEARSYNSHYGTTGYGVSGNGNFGNYGATYHHHSIGFDPINIMVSLSLLSFLLQTLQGLLTRTRLPTPVVEARSLHAIEDWTKQYENKLAKDKYYFKKKYMKNFY